MLKKKTLVPIGVGILALVLIAIGCRGGCSLTQTEDPNLVNATKEDDARVKVSVLDLSKESNAGAAAVFTGVVRPESEVTVVTLVRGQVVALYREVGDTVVAGTLLAELDNPELVTDLADAEVSFNNAWENLEETRLSAEVGVDQALLGVGNAELTLTLAQDSLINTQNSTLEDLVVSKKKVESAVLAHTRAQDDLVNTQSLNAQSEALLVDQAQSLYDSKLVILNNIESEVDDFFDDVDIQSAYSARDLQIKIDSKNEAIGFLNTLGSFLTVPHTVNTGSIRTDLASLKSIISQAHGSVTSIIAGLNKTDVSASVTATLLGALKTTYNGFEASITLAIDATDSLIDSVITTRLNNANNVQKKQTALDQAEIALLNARALETSLQATLATKVQQAQTSVAQAKNALDNAKKARSQAQSSQEIQLLTAKGNVTAQQSRLSLARIREGYTRLISPLDGVITKKYVEVGADINPSTPVYEIKNTDTLKVVVQVSERDLQEIYLGDRVTINNNLEGIIYSIEPELTTDSRKATVKILYIGNPSALTLGSLIEVRFPASNNTNLIFVPLKSVTLGTINTVRVVEDGRVALREVSVGVVQGTSVSIISGLESSDRVIIEGGDFLEIGQEVEVEAVP